MGKLNSVVLDALLATNSTAIHNVEFIKYLVVYLHLSFLSNKTENPKHILFLKKYIMCITIALDIISYLHNLHPSSVNGKGSKN